MTGHAEYAQLFTGLVLALLAATLGAAAAFNRWGGMTGRKALIVQTLFARINAWWAMLVAHSRSRGLRGAPGSWCCSRWCRSRRSGNS